MSTVERVLGGREIEVVVKASRRRLIGDYKRKIVREADACKVPGQSARCGGGKASSQRVAARATVLATVYAAHSERSPAGRPHPPARRPLTL